MTTTKEYKDKSKATDPSLQKGKLVQEQKKPGTNGIPTLTPDNDNGGPGAPANSDSSNKGKGPSGENL